MIGRTSAAIAISSFLLAGGAAVAQQYVISTYAGGAPPPMPVAALHASIGLPQGVTADAAGNVYFSSNSHCVFKLDLNGILTRVAGNSQPGYSGDGGPATDAQLLIPDYTEGGEPPGGLAMDSLGNLYIADFGNNRVRRVSPDGIITTVAGNGASGYSGDNGPAIDAQLNSPQSVALDIAGNLYITDTGNHRIRKVSLAGIITTVAGKGRPCCDESLGDGGPATSALLQTPSSLAIDSAGNLFVTGNWGPSRVRKVSPDGIITTVAGSTAGYSGDGAPAADGQLSAPTGLAVDSTGNLYILDAGNSRVRRVSPDGIITTVAGNGRSGYSGDGKPATSAQITGDWCLGLAVDTRGNIYLGDGYRIRKVSADGIITTVAGNGDWRRYSGDGGPATSAELSYPSDLAVDRAGNLYIADGSSSRVRKVSPNGVISTVAGNGVTGSLGDGGPATSAQLDYPRALAVDSAGNLYIAGNDCRVRRVSPNGIIRTVAGNGVRGSLGDGGPATSAQLAPISLAADAAGNLYIANEDYSNYGPPRFEPDYRVRKVSPAGIITTVAGNGMGGYSGDGGPATSAQLYTGPLAVDSAGDLYIFGYGLLGGGSRKIRKISSDGIITTVAGGGAFGHSGDGGPATSAHLHIGGSSLAVDSAGSLYFQELGRIRRVSPAGMITTIAGDGTYGYSGDGGPATQIGSPVGVAVDGAGNLYLADPWNAVVRILRPANRSVLIGAVVDAASQRADPVSPGKIVVIYGAGLGPSQLIRNQPRNGQFGTELTGVTVSFNEIAAPVLYASATQVAAVVPYSITGTTVRVTVTYQGEASNEFPLPIADAAPNLFTLNQTGAGHAAAVNAADGTANTAANPAKIGAYISLYATGEGQTAPAGLDGRIAGSNPARQVLPVTVTVGGIQAPVQYAGGAPGLVAGVMQVNVQIPSDVPVGGYVPVVLKVGDRTSSPAVWIAVSEN